MDHPDSGARDGPGAWDRPWQQGGGSDAPVLSVDGFEGPLDWLLHLARTRRIDLAQLPIVALVDAFADAMAAALAHPQGDAAVLGRWGQWLVMAADLTLLRSRLLLPADGADAGHATAEAEALRQALLGRAQVAQAADWLDRRPQLGRQVFARGQADGAGTAPGGRTGDVTGLLRACLASIQVPLALARAIRAGVMPAWTVADAIGRIRHVLAARGGTTLGRLLPHVPPDAPNRDQRCRAAVASTLVGGLELARQAEIAITQGDGGIHMQALAAATNLPAPPP